MNTQSDKERIATLLTALDTALEIARTIAMANVDDFETIQRAMNDLFTLEDYAKFLRAELTEEENAQAVGQENKK